MPHHAGVVGRRQPKVRTLTSKEHYKNWGFLGKNRVTKTLVLVKVFKWAVSSIFSVTLNSQKAYLYGCKRQNDGSVLLTITALVHRNWLHSTLAVDGKDGSGWPIFSRSSSVYWKNG